MKSGETRSIEVGPTVETAEFGSPTQEAARLLDKLFENVLDIYASSSSAHAIGDGPPTYLHDGTPCPHCVGASKVNSMYAAQ